MTLLLTGVRLAGELFRGPEWLFGRAAGGDGSLVGIGWAIPVVGVWFARRMPAQYGPAIEWRRAVLRTTAALLGVAAVFVVAKLLPVSVGTFVFVAATLPALALAGATAWPALGRALLLYGGVVRLGTIGVTIVAVQCNWGTHYEQLAPGAPAMAPGARTVVLGAAQLCLWIPLTVLIGCLSGLLARRSTSRGSRLRRRPDRA